MTIHVSAETVRQLVEKHVRNLYPGKLVSDPQVTMEPVDCECAPEHPEYFTGYSVTILDQSPFDLPPEKVKAGFDRARDAVRRSV